MSKFKNYTCKHIFKYLIFIVLTSSCRYTSVELPSYIADMAGKNAPELQKTLDHFSRFRKDSLKLKAAQFLINNMVYHYGVEYPYDKEIYTFPSLYNKALEGENWDEWDRLRKIIPEINRDKIKQRWDFNVVKASYLIGNINMAFDAWEKCPWKNGYSFDMFCDYILPYRIDTEPLTEWRKKVRKDYAWIEDSIKLHHDPAIIFSIIAKYFDKHILVVSNYPYPFCVSPELILETGVGTCAQMTDLVALVARAFGVPVVHDFNLAWANRSMGHDWNALVTPDGSPVLFMFTEPVPKPYKRVHLSRFFNFDFILVDSAELSNPSVATLFDNPGLPKRSYGYGDLPPEIKIEQEKYSAKVFRKMYSLQFPFGRTQSATIMDATLNYHSMDVSPDYLETVSVPMESRLGGDIAYLGVFNRNNNIFPVCYAINSGKGFVFDHIGRNVLYFPFQVNNNHLVYTGYPFYVGASGEIQEYKPLLNKPKQVTLYRKYPLFLNIAWFAKKMSGGEVQGANQPDFNDAVTLYKIKDVPVNITEARVNHSGRFRYLRYMSTLGYGGDIAEIQFFTTENGKNVKLTGDVMGMAGDKGREPEKAFDNSIETFYLNSSKTPQNAWVGIDLGKGNERQVTRVSICPRNDSNHIVPGNEYELFYWDNGWVSLGKQTATRQYLSYPMVPDGALFKLACNKGVEERPFIMKNGVQVFF